MRMKGKTMIRKRSVTMCGVLLAVACAVFVGCKDDTPAPDPPQVQVSEKLDDSSAFAAGVTLKAGGETIDVEVGHLVPCAVDWNNDGKKDLVVGQFAQGAIRLYLNAGTDTKPEFRDFTLLEAGGKPIKLDAG